MEKKKKQTKKPVNITRPNLDLLQKLLILQEQRAENTKKNEVVPGAA